MNFKEFARKVLHKGFNRFRSLSILRKIENKLRFRAVRFIALGETNHAFFRPGWLTVDLHDADMQCDLRDNKLPFAGQSVDVIYVSHLIEHISAEAGLALFTEICRCLKPGGVCRFLTPDMELLINRYKAGDWHWFFKANSRTVYDRICQGKLPAASILIHNRLLGWMASYSGRMDTAGGPLIEKELFDEKLSSLDKYEFRDWCVSLLEPGRVYAHIHLYDFDELSDALLKSGFSDVRRTDFGQSSLQCLRGMDRKKHELYSLCVEAKK